MHLQKKQLINNFESFDLYPMTNTERCILKETISRYLDELNDYKLIQFDSLYVRNYALDNLGTRFSIVMSGGNFYLLLLLRILEYWYTDTYYIQRVGLFELKRPELAIGRINSANLDRFVETLFSPVDNGMTIDRSLEIMERSFLNYWDNAAINKSWRRGLLNNQSIIAMLLSQS